MPGRGPLNVKRLRANTETIYQNYAADVTGVPDPGVPPDDPYDPINPHSPNVEYTRPAQRFSGALAQDVGGTLTGTLQAGSYANVSIYPGTTSQLPDPTMQGAIDAQYGADSTPAFRNRCLVVLKNFFLTSYGGAIPVIQTLAEHQTIDTFELLADDFCARVGVLTSSDYDFSGVRHVFLRGLVVTPPFAPADILEEVARVYNVYFVETDKIRAYERGSRPAEAALTSADLGWADGDAEEDEGQELPGLDIGLATETEIARRYELTAVDPDRDFEQNSQGTSRQVTSSEKTEKIELAVTLYPEEMREVTQRELYEDDIQSTDYAGTLDWSYLWLNPGATITVNEDDGTTHTIFVTSFKPNVGVIPFEGQSEEAAVYTQPVSTSGGGAFEVPPVPIPGQTLVGFIDGPPLRDAEKGEIGFYAYAYKRRGDGDFTGSALYVDRGLGYELLETFDKEATAGVAATQLTAATSTTGFVADAVTVDLHDEGDTLESFTEADLENGAGACLIGEEACQILTAAREPDTATYPNRWYLTIGLRARRGTASAVGTHVAGERFVLVDDAVRLVRVDPDEVGQTRSYKMVTSGQSLDDAAVVSFTFTGRKMRYAEPSALTLSRLDNTAGSPLLVKWGLPPNSELSADERYVVRIISGGNAVRRHTIQGNYPEPVQFQKQPTADTGENPALLTVGEDGTLEMDANADEFARAYATQSISGNSRVSWRLDSRNPPFYINFVGARTDFSVVTSSDEIVVPDHAFEEGDLFNPKSGIPAGLYSVINVSADRFQISATPGGPPVNLAGYTDGYFHYPSPFFASVEGIEAGGMFYVRPAQAAGFQVPAVAGAEYAVEFKDGIIYFYLIDQQTPVFRSYVQPVRHPYTIWASLGFLGGNPQAALRMTIQHANARSFLYTREMQENDFGGLPPAAVTVRVSRLSAIGEGLEAEATG